MIKLLLIALFLVIFFQDLKNRSVHWTLFPLLLLAAVLVQENELNYVEWIYNVCFLAFLMAALTVYVSLRNGKLVNITNGFFSWGDILFLIAVIPVFSFSSYLFFFTLGTMLTLILHLITLLFYKKDRTIPYAGYMSLIAVVYVLFQPFLEHLKSYIL